MKKALVLAAVLGCAARPPVVVERVREVQPPRCYVAPLPGPPTAIGFPTPDGILASRSDLDAVEAREAAVREWGASVAILVWIAFAQVGDE